MDFCHAIPTRAENMFLEYETISDLTQFKNAKYQSSILTLKNIHATQLHLENAH